MIGLLIHPCKLHLDSNHDTFPILPTTNTAQPLWHSCPPPWRSAVARSFRRILLLFHHHGARSPPALWCWGLSRVLWPPGTLRQSRVQSETAALVDCRPARTHHENGRSRQTLLGTMLHSAGPRPEWLVCLEYRNDCFLYKRRGSLMSILGDLYDAAGNSSMNLIKSGLTVAYEPANFFAFYPFRFSRIILVLLLCSLTARVCFSVSPGREESVENICGCLGHSDFRGINGGHSPLSQNIASH